MRLVPAIAAVVLAAAAPAGAEDADGGTPAAPGSTPAAAELPDAGPDPSRLPFGPESVRAVVVAHQPEIQACYEEFLARGENAQGEIRVALVVTPEGGAERVRVKRSTLKSGPVERCVVEAVRLWAFPHPAKRQPLELPFRFREEGAAKPAPARKRAGRG